MSNATSPFAGDGNRLASSLPHVRTSQETAQGHTAPGKAAMAAGAWRSALDALQDTHSAYCCTCKHWEPPHKVPEGWCEHISGLTTATNVCVDWTPDHG